MPTIDGTKVIETPEERMERLGLHAPEPSESEPEPPKSEVGRTKYKHDEAAGKVVNTGAKQ